MIILYHTGDKVESILMESGSTIDSIKGAAGAALFQIAQAYPSATIVWCDSNYKNQLDKTRLKTLLSDKNRMMSCSQFQSSCLNDGIHYVEESPFMKIQEKVQYPTWLMNTTVGGIHAQVLNQLNEKDFTGEDLGYVLNAIAKSCQSKGLFCYQAPLCKEGEASKPLAGTNVGNSKTVYRFVKQHYKIQWIFFLFIAQILFEKKWEVSALLASLFVTRKQLDYKAPKIKISKEEHSSTIDVIIPTMGRASYLQNVLEDLKNQTYLPEKVVIIEQNEDPKSISELDFLEKNNWPFKIIHQFIHQTGACNARNIALSHTTSDWVFFADDDIRFDSSLLNDSLDALSKLDVQCVAMSCLQENEKKTFQKIIQWSSFPSGAAIVSGTLSRKLNFNTSYEHGYGEDTDYGMQLRKEGVDVIYHPELELLHLKAPVGGFRKKIVKEWEVLDARPKPSPTVMLYRLTHTTNKQLQGYKLRLFLRQLKRVPLIQKLSFKSTFKQQWNTSIKWANYLNEQ